MAAPCWPCPRLWLRLLLLVLHRVGGTGPCCGAAPSPITTPQSPAAFTHVFSCSRTALIVLAVGLWQLLGAFRAREAQVFRTAPAEAPLPSCRSPSMN